jgi:hypothetical protein
VALPLSDFFSWSVIVPSLIALVTLGFGVLTLPKRPEYRIANGCFYAAAIYAWAKVIMWGITTTHGAGWRLPITFAAFAVISVLLIEGVRVVENRRHENEGLNEALHEQNPAAQYPPSPPLSEPQGRMFTEYNKHPRLLGLPDKIIPYQPLGENYIIKIRARLEYEPPHKLPALVVYVPVVHDRYATNDTCLFVVQNSGKILEEFRNDIKKDQSIIGLEARLSYGVILIVYHESELSEQDAARFGERQGAQSFRTGISDATKKLSLKGDCPEHGKTIASRQTLRQLYSYRFDLIRS